MLRWLILFLLLPFAALADGLPQPITSTVSDYDGILPAAAEKRLSDMLAKARNETGVHVALVTMDRREDHGGEGRSIEDYARVMFNTWGVGNTSRNNGILILVAKGDREMRVQLGSGFGTEWNGVAQEVIDVAFLPAFRAGDYVKGIETGTATVIDRIAAQFAAGKPAYVAGQSAHSGEGPASDNKPIIIILGTGAAMMGAFFVLRTLAEVFRHVFRSRVCPQCGKKGLEWQRETLERPTQSFSGKGQETTVCRFCDYHMVRTYVISALDDDDDDRGGRSSGGSSGGFGGRSSSGGGATGRW